VASCLKRSSYINSYDSAVRFRGYRVVEFCDLASHRYDVCGVNLFQKGFFRTNSFFFDRLNQQDFERQKSEIENIFVFVVVATFVTSVVGGILYLGAMEFVSARPDVFAAITGVALVATGLVRFYQNSEGRVSGDIDLVDSTLVGLLQGLAVIPGISRSGSTVFGLFTVIFQPKMHLGFLSC